MDHTRESEYVLKYLPEENEYIIERKRSSKPQHVNGSLLPDSENWKRNIKIAYGWKDYKLRSPQLANLNLDRS